jgi:hypothetical protein
MKSFIYNFFVLCILFSQIFLIKLKTSQFGDNGLNINFSNRTSNISDNIMDSTIINFNVSGMLVSHENLTLIPYLYGTVNITETH